MSLILDALRKMELERKARKQASTGLRQEVLNYRGSARHPERSLLIPAATALLLAVAAIGAYFYLAKGSTPPTTAAIKTPPIMPQPAAVPVQIVTPQPVAEPPKQAVVNPQEQLRTEAAQGSRKQNENLQSPPDSSLVVSGIAWQDERGLRRAVVNGQLVGEGAEMAGARVVEIRESRVRFNRGGSVIDINYP